MKSVFLFWVMGAINGHAKNFSVSIEAGGRYKLTPLYDVMSAYPLAEKRQIEWQDLKMAMALKGKNRHYRWHNIQLRHWLDTASRCQFDTTIMQKIIEEVFDQMDILIEKVTADIPNDFPQSIFEPTFKNMQKLKNRCRINH